MISNGSGREILSMAPCRSIGTRIAVDFPQIGLRDHQGQVPGPRATRCAPTCARIRLLGGFLGRKRASLLQADIMGNGLCRSLPAKFLGWSSNTITQPNCRFQRVAGDPWLTGRPSCLGGRLVSPDKGGVERARTVPMTWARGKEGLPCWRRSGWRLAVDGDDEPSELSTCDGWNGMLLFQDTGPQIGKRDTYNPQVTIHL